MWPSSACRSSGYWKTVRRAAITSSASPFAPRVASSMLWGATVELRSASREQIDYVTATSGFASAVPLRLHFGLGSDTSASEVRVTWPSGHVDTFEDLPADRHWVLVEGRGEVESMPLQRWSDRLEDSAITRDFTLPSSLRALSGERVNVEWRAKPTVVNLWASWCVACRRELPELSRLSSAREDIDIVGISLDEEASDAQAFVAAHPVDFKNYLADDAVLAPFSEHTTPSGTIAGHVRSRMHTGVCAARSSAKFRRRTSRRRSARSRPSSSPRAMPSFSRREGSRNWSSAKSTTGSSFLTEALRVNPDHVNARANLAAAYGKTDRLTAARAELEELVRRHPRNATAHTNLGILLHELDRHGRAIEQFEHARELDPSSELPRYYLASCLIEERRLSEAKTIAEAWLSDAPGNADAQKLLLVLQQMESGGPSRRR